MSVIRKYLLLLPALLLGPLLRAQPLPDMLQTLEDPKQKADTLQQLGRKFHMRAQPDSAAYCFQLGLTYAKQARDNDHQVVHLYSLLSRVSHMQRDPGKALAVIREARPYLRPDTPKPVLENYFFFTAQYFRLLLQYDSSLYYFQQTEKLNNSYRPYGNWYVYDGMAEVFLANSNYPKTEEYYRKAYQLTKKEGIRMDHGLVINRLANLYSRMNDPAKFAAILGEYNEFSKAGKKDFRKDPVHGLLFINWGQASLQQKTAFMKKVRDEHVRNRYDQGAALANYHIASLYEAAEQPEEALKYLYENRDFFIGNNAPADQYPNLQYIYKLEVKTGKATEALLTAGQLLELNTKLADLTNKELALELEKKYETEKKEKEIALLNSQKSLGALELLRETEQRQALEIQNRLKDSAIRQEQALHQLARRETDLRFSELEKEKLLNSSLTRENVLNERLLADEKKRKQLLRTGIALLAVAGGIILYQYRRQLRKNKIIEKQREDLEVLNREIHHRVKNNLQVISSLLDLQSESAGDAGTAEKFLEGSQRVQSMAYIHQNLYQGDRIDSIDLQQYVQMLTRNLLQSYNAEAGRITLSTDVEALKLHADTVIPLGMIINELVSNSLKYAFRNRESGHINLVLKRINEKLMLQVKDNGIGIPENLDVTAGTSFGYKIIKAFTQKLKAQLSIQKENGTDVQLLISRFKLA